jgi:hypothetical protein
VLRAKKHFPFIYSDPDQNLPAAEVLRANRFDVIHYAGHAAFQSERPHADQTRAPLCAKNQTSAQGTSASLSQRLSIGDDHEPSAGARNPLRAAGGGKARCGFHLWWGDRPPRSGRSSTARPRTLPSPSSARRFARRGPTSSRATTGSRGLIHALRGSDIPRLHLIGKYSFGPASRRSRQRRRRPCGRDYLELSSPRRPPDGCVLSGGLPRRQDGGGDGPGN